MKYSILPKAVFLASVFSFTACELIDAEAQAETSTQAQVSVDPSALTNTVQFNKTDDGCITSPLEKGEMTLCSEGQSVEAAAQDCQILMGEDQAIFKLCADISVSLEVLKKEDNLLCYPIVLTDGDQSFKQTLCEEKEHWEIKKENFEFDGIEKTEIFEKAEDCVVYLDTESNDISCLETVFEVDENGATLDIEIDEIFYGLKEGGMYLDRAYIIKLLKDEDFIQVIKEAYETQVLDTEAVKEICDEKQYYWEVYPQDKEEHQDKDIDKEFEKDVDQEVQKDTEVKSETETKTEAEKSEEEVKVESETKTENEVQSK